MWGEQYAQAFSSLNTDLFFSKLELACSLELGHSNTSLYVIRAKRTLIQLEGAIGQ